MTVSREGYRLAITPRIIKVTYRSAHTKRLVRTFTKVPYSGLFGLSETLVRAVSTGEVTSFSLTVAKPGEITPRIRASLQRWPEALASTSERSAVDWNL